MKSRPCICLVRIWPASFLFASHHRHMLLLLVLQVQLVLMFVSTKLMGSSKATTLLLRLPLRGWALGLTRRLALFFCARMAYAAAHFLSKDRR